MRKDTLDLIRRHFPRELLLLPQWVGWQYKGSPAVKGKAQKVPKNPKTGGNAMPNKPSTWGVFDEAHEAVRARGWDGVGFMICDGIVGIDFDNCRSSETGEIDPPILALCKSFCSYTEVSPSGTGLHIFGKGRLPDGVTVRRMGNVEVYGADRFFTVTGNVYAQSQHLTDVSAQLLAMLGENAYPAPVMKRNPGQQIADCDVIQIIERSSDAIAFASLNKGLWKKEEGGFHTFPSQSEADFTFCMIVARWSECNEEQIDRFFRQSGLYRKKWDKE